jgi:vacuolar-type H+-ATPase subunit E/Vma4
MKKEKDPNNKDHVQLVIDQIKKEAIDEKNRILKEAEEEKKRILKEAQQEAEKEKALILQKAKSDAKKIVAQGKSELQLASRDSLQIFKTNLYGLFENLLRNDAKKIASNEEYLAELFLLVKSQFADQNIEVSSVSKVIDVLQSKISDNEITLTIDEDLDRKILIKSGDKDFGISEDDMFKILINLCSPEIKSILTEKKED